MLVSHEKKFIFLKTTKSAGTSLEYAIASQLERSAIVTPQTSEENPDQRYAHVTWKSPREIYRQFKSFAREGYVRGFLIDLLRDILGGRGPVRSYYLANEYDHISASEIKSLLGPTIFENYLKVAVCRNPYDQIISLFFWRNYQILQEHPNSKPLDLLTWLREFDDRYALNEYILSINGESVVDVVLRYENLEEDLQELCKRLNLDYQAISLMMKEKRFKTSQRPTGPAGDYKLLITPEMKLMIDEIMDWDFKTFNYQKKL